MIWIHTTYCDFLQLRILTHNIRRLLRRFETGVKGAIGCGSFFLGERGWDTVIMLTIMVLQVLMRLGLIGNTPCSEKDCER